MSQNAIWNGENLPSTIDRYFESLQAHLRVLPEDLTFWRGSSVGWSARFITSRSRVQSPPSPLTTIHQPLWVGKPRATRIMANNASRTDFEPFTICFGFESLERKFHDFSPSSHALGEKNTQFRYLTNQKAFFKLYFNSHYAQFKSCQNGSVPSAMCTSTIQTKEILL